MMKRVEDAQKNKMGQRSPKVMKRAEDAQKNKMGQRSPNGTKEPKSDEMGQGSPKQHSSSPMIVLGYWNLAKGKHTAGPKEAKFAINTLWGDNNKTTTLMKRNFFFFWLPLGGHKFA